MSQHSSSALAPRGRRDRRAGEASASPRCSRTRVSGMARSKRSSPASIAASTAARSRCTSGACRSTSFSGATRSSPYEVNGQPSAAAARLSAPAGRPGLVRDDQREVALADHRPGGAVRRLPDAARLSRALRGGRARSFRSPRWRRGRSWFRPGFPSSGAASASCRPEPCEIVGRAWSGGAEVVRRRRSRRTAVRRGPRRSSATRVSGAGRGVRGASHGTPSRASTSSAAVRATRPGTSSRSRRPGTWAAI